MHKVDEVIERLRRKDAWTQQKPYWHERNPDGPEAADLLASMKEALEFYADHENWDGTYTVSGSKYAMNDDWSEPTEYYPDGKPGKRARNALNGEKNG